MPTCHSSRKYSDEGWWVVAGKGTVEVGPKVTWQGDLLTSHGYRHLTTDLLLWPRWALCLSPSHTTLCNLYVYNPNRSLPTLSTVALSVLYFNYLVTHTHTAALEVPLSAHPGSDLALLPGRQLPLLVHFLLRRVLLWSQVWTTFSAGLPQTIMEGGWRVSTRREGLCM